ncbi:phage gp6-like head-tail connector protein [Micromonospora sp. 15K316]|uniref:phage gp6-like head-tail connector protein n=1 Tax=unclassified Micromonospora TaxID=2617518 RepID=UPI00104DE5CA|nr:MULTISPECIES: phage gp6-like head-tail connector protein [unclassified Micromonospora]TDB71801.1 phage gp6-like head-tail connector protein [Micromonospora sp. KC723]TDC35660.1 phage gp6-like head-tail connector protein [Micromonospora sp. 15K316]
MAVPAGDSGGSAPWGGDYLDAVTASDWLYSPGVDEADVALWCTAASRAVDKRCNRQFGIVDAPEARTYRRPAVYDVVSGLWLLEIDDVQDVTGLRVAGVAYADSGAVLLPDDAELRGRPYERLGFADFPGAPVVVEALWGWPEIPAQVIQACKLQVSRWSSRRHSPYGIAGSPSDGSEMRLLSRLDPDVATTLAGLSRRRRVA